MGLLEKIKEDAKKSGQNKGKLFYVREGEKKRVRFLQDMQDGFEVTMHDNFEAGINVPCRELYGKDCPYCGEEGIRTRSQYAWSVWDYDANETKILMYAMNNCTPIATIASMYETYGTLTDRDYVISKSGRQQNTQYTVIPMDKNKFRNDKAKAYSRSAFLKMLAKAFPDDKLDDLEDDEEDTKSKRSKDDDKDELPWVTPGEDKEESEYDGKSAKELYKLCKERDIEVEPKKPEVYYINLLKENDKAHDDWDDDDDEWDDVEESEDEDEWDD